MAGRVFQKFWSPLGRRSGLSRLLLHHHTALVVELALIPMGAVEHVGLARAGARGHVWRFCLVVCPALA